MDVEPGEAGPREPESLAVASTQHQSTGGEVCTNCGQPMIPGGAPGQCLRCLVNFAAVTESEALTEEPADEASAPRTRRYGHFEIASDGDGLVIELGRGAMGTTYRAQDTVLHSSVALKIIDRKVADHPAARARFLREARAAAQLRHPNVASVYHFGEQDGECFYGMELIEGETLEERVRRDGPLPVLMALDIIGQVARALTAAEARGIIHRDLKPSNIMLVAAGENRVSDVPSVVKVIDFGLAKAMSPDSEAPGLLETRAGFVGTPAFASPEQFARAKDERIDTRSDVFSLGVTLWYLLCGKLPFVGKTLTEIHEQQTSRPLPLIQLRAAGVPAPLVSLIRSMLAVAPVGRPQSARELLAMVSHCHEQLSPARRATRRRFAAWALACGVSIVATGITFVAWWQAAAPAPPTAGPSVAVLPLETLGPNPSEAFFTRGVQDAITADLTRISQLKVVGSDSVKPYPPGKVRDLPAVARTLGVAHLIEGSVRRDEARVQLELRLVEPGDPARIWTGKYDRPLTEEFALLSEVALALAKHLHVLPSAGEIVDIERRPTHDPIAYDLYLRSKEGLTFLRDEAQLRQQSEKHLAMLNAAVSRDPGFALAYCAIAKAHDDLATRVTGASAQEIAVDHGALAEGALAQARRLQPDSAEVHSAYAYHCLLVTHEFERARTEVDLARRTLPNNVRLESIAGRIAMRQERWSDALGAFEKTVALDPRSPNRHILLGDFYQALRRYDDAYRESTMLGSLLPPAALGMLPMGRSMLALEGRADLAPLRAAIAELPDAEDPDHEARDQYQVLLAFLERDESRMSFVLAASKHDHFESADFVYPKSWYAALAARLRKDDVAARAAFIAARSEVQKTVLANARDERNLLLLAMIDAGLGRVADAVSEAQRACAMPPLEPERMTGPSDRCCLAVVYAWTNQKELALAELKKLVSGPAGANYPSQPTYGDLKLNPLWDPLRTDPRFDALTATLAPKGTH